MQNNMLTMTYNPRTGTNTPLLIPMQPITIVYRQNLQLPTQVAPQTNKSVQTQRTYRPKSINSKPIISDDDKSTENEITETKTIIYTELKTPDSMFKRRMRPYMTSGQRHRVKQTINKMFLGTSSIADDIDDDNIEIAATYTPRARQFDKVARNILSLPEYQQRKKEILRSGASIEQCKHTDVLPKKCITKFDNSVRINGAIVYTELNFNITR